MSSKEPRRRFLAKVQPPVLLPPNLTTLEVRPFTAQDRQTLRTWLTEEGWPRGTMDVAMLEGYLVALLTWPVGITSGALLPPIWGEKAGWRVPAKIAAQEPFDTFIALVVGLLRDLDSRLEGSKTSFVPTLLADERGRRWPRATGVSWAHGFLKGLQQNAQGLQDRSPTVRAARDHHRSLWLVRRGYHRRRLHHRRQGSARRDINPYRGARVPRSTGRAQNHSSHAETFTSGASPGQLCLVHFAGVRVACAADPAICRAGPCQLMRRTCALDRAE